MRLSVRELLTRFDSRELAEWEAYYQLDPFGEERADLQIACVVAAIYNVNRKEGTPAIKPEDVMLKFGEDPGEKPRQSREDMDAVFAGLAQMMEAQKNRGKHRDNRR